MMELTIILKHVGIPISEDQRSFPLPLNRLKQV